MHRAPQHMDVATACVPNIGLRGRRRRLLSGIVFGLITAVVFALLLARNARTAWFLAILPLAMIASIYFFQAKEKT